jgi:hypothetical protein
MLEDPLHIAQISRPGAVKAGVEPSRIVLVLREYLRVRGRLSQV